MEGGRGVENYICALLIWTLSLVRGYLKAGNTRWAKSRYTVYSIVLILHTYFWPTLYFEMTAV